MDAVVLFVGSYLAVWAAFGVAVFAVYRPHGPLAAGAITIEAGLYEFTPLKQAFRRRCREHARSGFEFGLCCVGSSIGLMAMLAALGIMSPTWMIVIAVLVIVQKFVPMRAANDLDRAGHDRIWHPNRYRARGGSWTRAIDIRRHPWPSLRGGRYQLKGETGIGDPILDTTRGTLNSERLSAIRIPLIDAVCRYRGEL